MRHLLPALLALAPLPALAQAPSPALAETYLCAGGAVLQVAYLNPASGESYAVVAFGGRLIPMQAGISGSGVRYVALDPASGLVWHTKGAEGFLAHDAAGDQQTILDACTAVGS